MTSLSEKVSSTSSQLSAMPGMGGGVARLASGDSREEETEVVVSAST